MATALQESIIFKKSGKVVPKEVIGQIQVNADGSVGSARIIDGNFKIFRKAETIDIDSIVNVMSKDLLPLDVIFFLSKRKPVEDDLQPTVLLEDEGEAVLIVFTDGEVDLEKLEDYVDHQMQLSNGDLIKCMNVLDGPACRSEIAKLWKDRGHITLMDITGKILNFRNNPKFEEAEWGWTSNGFHPEKKAEAPAPTSGVPKMSAAERIAAKQKATEQDDLGITKKGAPGTGPQPDTAVPDDAGKEPMVTIGPPPSTLNNSGKRSWWMKRLGEVPHGYKMAIVSVPKSKLKNVEPHIPTEVKPQSIEQSVVTEVHTILDPKIIESVKSDFSKAKLKGQTLEEREAFAKKYPSWSTQFGRDIPIEDIFNWDFLNVRGLAVKYPFAAAVLLYEFIALYMSALSDLDKATAAPAKEPDKPLSAAERIARKAGKVA